MRELSIWADAHCTAGDRGVFRTVAQLEGYLAAADGYTDNVTHCGSGAGLLDILDEYRGGEIDHLVLAGHGGSTWWLDDEHGITTRHPQHRDQVPIDQLADILADVLSPRPLISLAACMCSRSPRWFLRERWGSVGSDWGRRAYLPGGQASFSARLRDGLQWYSVFARVRGHRASGHASALALLAEHSGVAGLPCDTFFGRALPDIEPTGANRRWWTRTVTGRLAQRWLMGDDSTETEVRALFARDHRLG